MGIPFVRGEFDLDTQREQGSAFPEQSISPGETSTMEKMLYPTMFAEDHAMIYHTRSLQAYPLLDPYSECTPQVSWHERSYSTSLVRFVLFCENFRIVTRTISSVTNSGSREGNVLPPSHSAILSSQEANGYQCPS